MLLVGGCGGTTKVVTRVVAPEPCHLPKFPEMPDITPTVGTSDGAIVVGFPPNEFEQLTVWLQHIGDWHDVVMLCPQVTDKPRPGSVAEVVGIDAVRLNVAH